jgi:hypothetical protein
MGQDFCEKQVGVIRHSLGTVQDEEHKKKKKERTNE